MEQIEDQPAASLAAATDVAARPGTPCRTQPGAGEAAMGPAPVTKPAETLRRERASALELRVAGWSEGRIAAHLGITAETVREHLHHELTQAQPGSAERRAFLREIETARLEKAIEHLLPLLGGYDKASDPAMSRPGATGEGKEPGTANAEAMPARTAGGKGAAVSGEKRCEAAIKVAEAIIKLDTRISALHGLDAPARPEVSGLAALENIATIRARLAAKATVEG